MSRTPAVAQIGHILSQIQARNPSNFSALFDVDSDILYSAKAKKDEEVYTVKSDVLAHIIAALEAEVPAWEIGSQWKEALTADPKLEAHSLTPLRQDHINRAAMIRRYYRNRLTLLSFKQESMSQFRKDLYDFLTLPETQIKLSFLPMMIRLPAFYLEDVIVDNLVKTHKMPERNEPYPSGVESKTLHFVDKTYRKTKNQNTKHYWFVDENSMLHRLAIDETNKLRHVFERFLHAPVTIEAKYPVTVLRGRDVNFYSVEGDWRLL
jgi:hypothetical protein